jgi:hypothetical protein
MKKESVPNNRLDRAAFLFDFGRVFVAGLVIMMVASCATTGSSLGSGVGDRFFDEPPYYSGRLGAIDTERVAHLPIGFQPGAVQASIFEPDAGEGSPIGLLLEEMNRHLDGMGFSDRLAAPGIIRQTPPDVRFGCEPVIYEECDSDYGDISVQGSPWMLLAVGRPSPRWVSAVAASLAEEQRDYVLVITLEVGQYWTHQKNLLGAKEVRLGTNHSQGVPWLTSLDQPVQVLQLTGALVDREGRAVRVGAEGLVAERTNIVLSGFGAQELITDETVHHLRTSRRPDVAGNPLVWQVALENLVAALTGQVPSLTR